MEFHFPSLYSVLRGTADTLRRFPLSLISAITASTLCIYLIGLGWEDQKKADHLWKMVMCCWLGLNLFLSMSLIAERGNHAALKKYGLQLLGVLLLTGYFFLLPELEKMTVRDVTRYALFSIGLHLLVSFSPFIGKGEVNGFWQFNKTLFLRFLLSALYAGVLFVGLALALTVVNQLFNAGIKEERYAQLWFTLAGIFNTWFFLSGVPRDLGSLETVTDYPKGLKIFTQFILLPLLALYLLILYAYGIKIMVQWQLPKGWVSWMVNAFSVFGILSLLLIYPIRNDENNRWINIFSKWFYRALFPLILLLGAAIGKRVIEYGITENRYFVSVVALWLAAMAVYFLASKKQNIKVIPVSLFFVVFLSSFGPWGAFSVSEKSQVNRLEKLLMEEKILVNGKIQKADSVSRYGRRQIVAIVHYLDESHNFDAIKPWFNQDLDTVLAPQDSVRFVDKPAKVLALMGVKDSYYNRFYTEEENEEMEVNPAASFYYASRNSEQYAIPLEDFEYSCKLNIYVGDENNPQAAYTSSLMHIGGDSGSVGYSTGKKAFTFVSNGRDILHFDLDGFVRKISDAQNEDKKYVDHDISPDLMQLRAENDSVKIRYYISGISGERVNEKMIIKNVGGTMLIKMSKPANPTHAGPE